MLLIRAQAHQNRLVMNEVIEVADVRWDGRSPTEARDRRTEVVGGGTVDLGGGQTEIIKISLNAVGQRLLAARNNLKVKLLATAPCTTIFGSALDFKLSQAHRRT